MKLFFHHVGIQGAEKDFKKTVYTNVSIEEICKHIPSIVKNDNSLVSILEENFPSGYCNVWGVPIGAKSVIKNLKVGDVVLLVKSASTLGGDVPVLCEVKAYINYVQLPELSKALWGNDKFPYIFFFNTFQISYDWLNMIEDLSYSHKYNPRGTFCAVSDERFEKWESTHNYVEFIKTNFDSSIIDNEKLKMLKADIVSEEADEYQLRYEGGIKYFYGKRYERDLINRKRALEIFGYKCNACGFNFEEVYGEWGKDFIEVHHIKPISSEGEQLINPATDLVPVCSNCHRMIHRRKDEVLNIEELRQILKSNKRDK